MTAETFIQVQTEPFNQNEMYQWLNTPDEVGACVVFVGKVRNHNQGNEVSGLYLEHYPAMTQLALEEIVQEAEKRWAMSRVAVIHRVGQLNLNDEIVLVGVSSLHRENAFAAASFIMDYLKTKAPFWKKETTTQGERWVEENQKDQQVLQKWQKEH